jgi:hypothetical protein
MLKTTHIISREENCFGTFTLVLEPESKLMNSNNRWRCTNRRDKVSHYLKLDGKIDFGWTITTDKKLESDLRYYSSGTLERSTRTVQQIQLYMEFASWICQYHHKYTPFTVGGVLRLNPKTPLPPPLLGLEAHPTPISLEILGL